MYCKGSEEGVKGWVAPKGLRYKDYRLVAKPSAVESSSSQTDPTGLFEVAAVNEFANAMAERGNATWFERAMGFS